MKKKIKILILILLLLLILMIVILFNNSAYKAMDKLKDINVEDNMGDGTQIPNDMYKLIKEYKGNLDTEIISKTYYNFANNLLPKYYKECKDLIDSMKFNSSVFGIEKEKGKLEGILAAIYQNVFGEELYPSIEEKAANLLYFIIKDHPFADGCKRIGASLFLEFLNKNKHLIIDGKQIISNSALVAITLMIAESRPEEKETMVRLVMNFLR